MRTCESLVCDVSFEETRRDRRFCSVQCRSNEHHRKIAAEVLPARACALASCGRSFVPTSPRGRFCQVACQQREEHTRVTARRKLKLASAEERAAKQCLDCSASLAEQDYRTKRCAPCQTKRKRDRDGTFTRARRHAGGVKPRVFKEPVTGTRARGPAVKQEPKPKPVSPKQLVVQARAIKRSEEQRARERALKPNMKGDWFPGWDGFIPPSFSPLERELLLKSKGALA